MLDWDDLRFFVALADEGSLSAAARRLRVDHATVARRVQALEEKAGIRLFDRRPRRYLLTEKGRLVAERARRMEGEVFALERDILETEGEAPVEISVSAPPVLTSFFLTPKIAAFYEARPRIRLRLVADVRNVSLTRREADIAVRLSRPTDPSLIIRKAGSVRYLLLASPAYLATRRPEQYGFILFDDLLDETPQQVWLKRMAAGRETVLRTNDLGVQCAAAAAGVGIAALPDFVAATYGLKVAGDEGEHIMRDIYITYHHDLRDSDTIAAAVGFLAECLRPER
ncbi:LysR family transcriptional regulator [Rhizobium cremeum]|uniref:LysR family transcriptional regulator n=1 Tax=Rhizobium cremeum TaxID=2813827 RepID=UPI001FD35728|nr:LysR family transcriptional regulator [Rhizobium cremeum]MCJ7996259.1 LysR family transcriptional regulator [Rhizobium cremeum]MCJ8001518.1 LysR family transcriptional regulator [Rhizobium cremeum]